MKNKKHFLSLLFIIILFINAFSILYSINYNKKDESTVNDKLLIAASDPVNLIWNRTWFDYQYAGGNAIGLDSINNTYITGYTGSVVNSLEACLVKYDSSGQFQWDRTWGILGTMDADFGQAIRISSTGDIYVLGYTEEWLGFGYGDRDVFLLKYNSTGDLQWYDVWGGSGYDMCYEIAIDNNNNIFLGGYTESWNAEGYAMCLLKYNTSGALEWNRTWGEGFFTGAMGIVVDSSNNIYLGGKIGPDMCLVKFDNFGVWQWNRSWNTLRNVYCRGITIDSSDDIYLVGEGLIFIDNSTGFGIETSLLKYNKFGELQWSHIWNTTTGSTTRYLINGISLDSSNNIYLAKRTIDDNMELEKFDSSGNKEWDYVFGSTGTDSCNGIVIDTGNNIYMTGRLDSNMYVAKFIENPPETPEPGIPGYNLWMLICVLSVVSSVIAFSISLKLKLSKKIE